MNNRTITPVTLAHRTVDCRDRMVALMAHIAEAQQLQQRIVLMAEELQRELRSVASIATHVDDQYHVGQLARLLQEPQR